MSNHQSLSQEAAFAALEAGVSLLTVNRRLSRSLLQRYHQYQQAQAKQAWETPDILPWSAWISRCLQQASYLALGSQQPAALSQEQELALWEEIIRASKHSQGLLYLGQTARQAREAWILLRHWQLPDEAEPWLWSSPDQEAFWEWSRDFLDLVQTRGWLEEARQPEHLLQLFKSHILPCPEGVILAGFEQLSPMQEQILQTLQAGGCSIHFLEPCTRQGRVFKLALQDQKQELRLAARWARAHLLSNPQQSLGLIVPDLSRLRQEVMHTLDAVLHPDNTYNPHPPGQRCYDISLGQSLIYYPLIRAALSILDLVQNPLQLQTLSSILCSPFVQAADSELIPRARLEVKIREKRQASIRWQEVLHLLDSDSCPVLARAMRAFQTRLQELPRQQPLSTWAQDLDLLLRDLGWPGQRSLSSPEYQTLQAWYSSLQRLAGLDRIWPEVGLQKAIYRLREILAQTIFQPEGPQVQLRVMGMLEAAGENWDRIWVLGLNDQIWPQAPDPNPFLPLALQRKLNMPRSSPEHELSYARQITTRLLKSAEEVLLSYPQQQEDRELLPSPLLADIPALEPEDLQLAWDPDPWQEHEPRTHLESFFQDKAPGLASHRAPGGSGLLRSQAACPFQAFARHRLGVKALQEPVPGLGAPERGSVMHQALEYFWQSCQDQNTLLALSSRDKQDLVQQAASCAVQKQAQARPSLNQEFLALEQERLQGLILEWLQLEEQRSPFQVQELETRLQISIGGLELQVVADRIDRLQNGRLVVLDYKSGRHSVTEWLQERPVEPQVPLYSLFCSQPVAGVYFAVLRKGESRFVGLGEEPGIVPGCKGFAQHWQAREFKTWQELLQTWRSRLQALAEEVLSGEARVAPNNQQACRQCDLHPFCRIFELQKQ